MCIITNLKKGPDNNHPPAPSPRLLNGRIYDANHINKTLAVQGTLLQVQCIAFTSIKRKVGLFNFSSGVVPSTEVWEHKPAWTHPLPGGWRGRTSLMEWAGMKGLTLLLIKIKKKTKEHLKNVGVFSIQREQRTKTGSSSRQHCFDCHWFFLEKALTMDF